MTNRFAMRLLIATALLCNSAAHAADKISEPYVTPDKLGIEYFGSRTVDDSRKKDDKQKQQFAVTYGMNDFWKTGLYGKFAKDAGDNLTFDAWEWKNTFQLTRCGEYWFDVGMSAAYEWTPQSNHADILEARLLIAKDLGDTAHVMNINGIKQVGSGNPRGLEGKILWSSRYKYISEFEPGFEIESSFGELKHMGSFDSQKHYAGPAAYGTISLPLAEHAGKLHYRAAYLLGASNAAEDGQAIVHLVYGLPF